MHDVKLGPECSKIFFFIIKIFPFHIMHYNYFHQEMNNQVTTGAVNATALELKKYPAYVPSSEANPQ